jgi:hypothetical protein
MRVFVPEVYAPYFLRPPTKADQTAWQQQVDAFRANNEACTIAIYFVGV